MGGRTGERSFSSTSYKRKRRHVDRSNEIKVFCLGEYNTAYECGVGIRSD